MRVGDTSILVQQQSFTCHDKGGGKVFLPPTLFKAVQSFVGHVSVTCSTEHHKYILIVLVCAMVYMACSTEQSF